MIVVFIIAIAGVLFSGYLSYYELFVPGGCSAAIVSCGTKNVTIASLPACVYGLVMYLTLFVVSGVALYKNRNVKA